MANWLQKILPPAPPAQTGRNLPSQIQNNRPLVPVPGELIRGVPNASVIYGMAASALFVIALYFVFNGKWITGGLVLLPAGCFLGYALHFLKYYR